MSQDPHTEDHRRGRPAFIPGTPKELDAVIACPANHEIIFENDKVRVLRVTIHPHEIEKEHTHEWPSVFIINQFPAIKYYNEKGEVLPNASDRKGREGVPFWVGPEGVHKVENPTDDLFVATRIELKS